MKKLKLLLILFAFTFFSLNAQSFEDINASLPAFAFSVCAFGDADGDGDLDLYLSGMDEAYSISGGLFIYDAGTYTISATANIPAIYMGSADWGDIDGDGDMDIVIMGVGASYADITEVYQNNGDGTFSSLDAGIAPAEQGEVTFADFNGDTYPDVTLTGIIAEEPYRITSLYSNDGAGVFTKETSIVLPGMNLGRIKWADYDNDSDLDFVLTGYDDATGGSQTYYSEIHTNNGDGSFSVSDITLHQGWLGDTEWGDYNADGYIDLVLSGAGGDGSERYTLLYKNNGNGTFTEIDPAFPGVSHSGLEWGDFDSDGDLDLFIVGETTTPGEGNSVSKIFNNNGNDVFTESSEDVFNYSFYGDADSGDFNGDGKKDLVISGYFNTSYESNSAVYKNTNTVSVSFIEESISIFPIPANNFLKIESPDNINNVKVFTISGKEILSQSLNSQKTILDIRTLSSGLYFIKINTSSKEFTRKIIIE